LIGWLIADRLYRQKPRRAAELAAAAPGAYNLLTNKFYVDEFYGATIVKPILGISTYFLDWMIDKAVIGGAAWMLGAVAKFSGALLQRWQSGNIRSYAAWLTAGAAALLLFVLVPWSAVLAHWFGIHVGAGGH
jgi:NADH-quinone oxidoreductase subunit L